MATRVTPSDVKEIIDTDLTDTRVQSFIDSASALIDATIADRLTDTLLTEIEKWLSAHLIATTNERQLRSGTAGPAKADYFGKDGVGLDSSTYGQQVRMLDTTGKLYQLSSGKAKATLQAL